VYETLFKESHIHYICYMATQNFVIEIWKYSYKVIRTSENKIFSLILACREAPL